MTPAPRDPVTLAVFVLVVLIGGINFVAVRYSNQGLDPFWGAAVRFAAGSALLFAIARVGRRPLPPRSAAAGVVLYGLLSFGVSYALAYWALLTAPAALASVVVALVPLLTFFLAVAHRMEAFRLRGLAGGLLAIAGVAIVFSDQLGSAVPPAALLALCGFALCIAYATIVAKRLPRMHPVVTNAVGMVPGAALLLLLSFSTGESRTLPTTGGSAIALAYLATVGSAGLFIGFLFLLTRWTASATSYAAVLFPIVTVAVGFLLAREPVSLGFALGAALAIVGVYVGAIARPEAGKQRSAAG